MIADWETDYLYLADCLPIKYPDFYTSLSKSLTANQIGFGLLPGTNDIWARDYMAVQVTANRFVQFIYNPDYLQSKRWRKTITIGGTVCHEIGIVPHMYALVVDGGNVVRSCNSIIMCDKVFTENPHYSRDILIGILHEIFGVDRICFIPTPPNDFTGHADGLVRFIDEDTVLINKYSKERGSFKAELYKALTNSDLRCIEVPYNPYSNKNYMQANGIYINYLHMNGVLFIPTYGIAEDDIALKQFEDIFDSCVVVPVESNAIANQGGVLNCISWNIKT